MATDKQTIKKEGKNRKIAFSGAWVLEFAFRVFIGWILLSNFDNIIATFAALYALGTAGAILLAHFYNAHN